MLGQALPVIHLLLVHMELVANNLPGLCDNLRLRCPVIVPVVFLPATDFLDKTVLGEVGFLELGRGALGFAPLAGLRWLSNH